MQFRFNFIKTVAFATTVFFTWETTSAYALPSLSLIPKAIASVESQAAPSDKTALLLLDAHTSSDAQKNISELLKFLQGQGVDLIGLEGADDKIDGTIFREVEDKQALAKESWEMVKEGIFTGAEYFYINTEKLPAFYGLEDKALYLENRDAFINTISSKEKLTSTLNSISEALGAQKKRVYSKKLYEFDRIQFLHKEEDLAFLDYLSKVIDAAQKARLVLSEFPNLYSLSKAVENEKKISREGLEQDLDKLQLSLRAKALSSLRKQGSSERSLDSGFRRNDENTIDESIFNLIRNRQSQAGDDLVGDYQKIHSYFSNLIKENQFTLSEYKHFSKFFKWLESFVSFDSKKLFDELELITESIYQAFAVSEKEKTLVAISSQFELFKKMISIELTPKEWEKISGKEMVSFKGMPQISNIEIELTNEVQRSAREFYELAEKRNSVFAEKIANAMKKQNKNVSAVVIGGFHEIGLKTALEARGISTAVVAPKINGALSDIPYLDQMMGKSVEASTIQRMLNISFMNPIARQAADERLQKISQKQNFTSKNNPTQKNKKISNNWANNFVTSPAISIPARVVASRRSEARETFWEAFHPLPYERPHHERREVADVGVEIKRIFAKRLGVDLEQLDPNQSIGTLVKNTGTFFAILNEIWALFGNHHSLRFYGVRSSLDDILRQYKALKLQEFINYTGTRVLDIQHFVRLGDKKWVFLKEDTLIASIASNPIDLVHNLEKEFGISLQYNPSNKTIGEVVDLILSQEKSVKGLNQSIKSSAADEREEIFDRIRNVIFRTRSSRSEARSTSSLTGLRSGQDEVDGRRSESFDSAQDGEPVEPQGALSAPRRRSEARFLVLNRVADERIIVDNNISIEVIKVTPLEAELKIEEPGKDPLTLQLRKDASIAIANGRVKLIIGRLEQNKVKLVFDAPRKIPIHREEIQRTIEAKTSRSEARENPNIQEPVRRWSKEELARMDEIAKIEVKTLKTLKNARKIIGDQLKSKNRFFDKAINHVRKREFTEAKRSVDQVVDFLQQQSKERLFDFDGIKHEFAMLIVASDDLQYADELSRSEMRETQAPQPETRSEGRAQSLDPRIEEQLRRLAKSFFNLDLKPYKGSLIPLKDGDLMILFDKQLFLHWKSRGFNAFTGQVIKAIESARAEGEFGSTYVEKPQYGIKPWVLYREKVVDSNKAESIAFVVRNLETQNPESNRSEARNYFLPKFLSNTLILTTLSSGIGLMVYSLSGRLALGLTVFAGGIAGSLLTVSAIYLSAYFARKNEQRKQNQTTDGSNENNSLSKNQQNRSEARQAVNFKELQGLLAAISKKNAELNRSNDPNLVSELEQLYAQIAGKARYQILVARSKSPKKLNEIKKLILTWLPTLEYTSSVEVASAQLRAFTRIIAADEYLASPLLFYFLTQAQVSKFNQEGGKHFSYDYTTFAQLFYYLSLPGNYYLTRRLLDLVMPGSYFAGEKTIINLSHPVRVLTRQRPHETGLLGYLRQKLHKDQGPTGYHVGLMERILEYLRQGKDRTDILLDDKAYKVDAYKGYSVPEDSKFPQSAKPDDEDNRYIFGENNINQQAFALLFESINKSAIRGVSFYEKLRNATDGELEIHYQNVNQKLNQNMLNIVKSDNVTSAGFLSGYIYIYRYLANRHAYTYKSFDALLRKLVDHPIAEDYKKGNFNQALDELVTSRKKIKEKLLSGLPKDFEAMINEVISGYQNPETLKESFDIYSQMVRTHYRHFIHEALKVINGRDDGDLEAVLKDHRRKRELKLAMARDKESALNDFVFAKREADDYGSYGPPRATAGGEDDLPTGLVITEPTFQTVFQDYLLSQVEVHIMTRAYQQYSKIDSKNLHGALNLLHSLAHLNYENGLGRLSTLDRAQSLLNPALTHSQMRDILQTIVEENNSMINTYRAMAKKRFPKGVVPDEWARNFIEEDPAFHYFNLVATQLYDFANEKTNQQSRSQSYSGSQYVYGEPKKSDANNIGREPVVVGNGLSHQDLENISRDFGRYGLGGKGINLVHAVEAGVEIPPIAIIPIGYPESQVADAAVNSVSALESFIDKNPKNNEAFRKLKFGDSTRPLLVSVRSGGYDIMPGQMPTISNVGINQEIVEDGLTKLIGAWGAWDSYARFIKDWAEHVLNIPSADIEKLHRALLAEEVDDLNIPITSFRLATADQMKRTTLKLKEHLENWIGEASIFPDDTLLASLANTPFPQDPLMQLKISSLVVKKSWHLSDSYRKAQNLRGDWQGTIVGIQAMYFGNAREDRQGAHPRTAGAASVFSRRMDTGDRRTHGDLEFFVQGASIAQGETEEPYKIEELDLQLGFYIERMVSALERRFNGPLQLEITFQKSHPKLLQGEEFSIPVNSPDFASELPAENLIGTWDYYVGGAYRGLPVVFSDGKPDDLEKVFEEKFRPLYMSAKEQGLDGLIVFIDHLNPKDANLFTTTIGKNGSAIRPFGAVVTNRGGTGSHGAVIARDNDLTMVSGVPWRELVHEDVIKEGETVLSLNGRTGEIARGSYPILNNAATNRSELRSEHSLRLNGDLSVASDKGLRYLKQFEFLWGSNPVFVSENTYFVLNPQELNFKAVLYLGNRREIFNFKVKTEPNVKNKFLELREIDFGPVNKHSEDYMYLKLALADWLQENWNSLLASRSETRAAEEPLFDVTQYADFGILRAKHNSQKGAPIQLQIKVWQAESGKASYVMDLRAVVPSLSPNLYQPITGSRVFLTTVKTSEEANKMIEEVMKASELHLRQKTDGVSHQRRFADFVGKIENKYARRSEARQRVREFRTDFESIPQLVRKKLAIRTVRYVYYRNIETHDIVKINEGNIQTNLQDILTAKFGATFVPNLVKDFLVYEDMERNTVFIEGPVAKIPNSIPEFEDHGYQPSVQNPIRLKESALVVTNTLITAEFEGASGHLTIRQAIDLVKARVPYDFKVKNVSLRTRNKDTWSSSVPINDLNHFIHPGDELTFEITPIQVVRSEVRPKIKNDSIQRVEFKNVIVETGRIEALNNDGAALPISAAQKSKLIENSIAPRTLSVKRMVELLRAQSKTSTSVVLRLNPEQVSELASLKNLDRAELQKLKAANDPRIQDLSTIFIIASVVRLSLAVPTPQDEAVLKPIFDFYRVAEKVSLKPQHQITVRAIDQDGPSMERTLNKTMAESKFAATSIEEAEDLASKADTTTFIASDWVGGKKIDSGLKKSLAIVVTAVLLKQATVQALTAFDNILAVDPSALQDWQQTLINLQKAAEIIRLAA